MSEAMQRRYVALLCLHGEEHLGTGNGDYTDEEVRRALGISRRAAAETKALFTELGFMDENWKIFSFERWQRKSDNSAERVKRYRSSRKISEKEENVTLQSRYCNGDVTVQSKADEEQNRKEKRESRAEEEQSRACCDAVPVLPGSPSDEETISRYRRAFEVGLSDFEAKFPTIDFEREWAAFIEPALRKKPAAYASKPDNELHEWFVAWWRRVLKHYKGSSRASEEVVDWVAYAKECEKRNAAMLSAEPPPEPPPPEMVTCPDCADCIERGRGAYYLCKLCGGTGRVDKAKLPGGKK